MLITISYNGTMTKGKGGSLFFLCISEYMGDVLVRAGRSFCAGYMLMRSRTVSGARCIKRRISK